MSSSNRTSSAVPASAISTFRVHKPPQAKTGRATYTPERRQKVNSVRKKRACLRCSFLKIPCSHDDICTPCEELALKTYEKRTLSFSACIRTKLVEVSIFEDVIPPPDTRRTMLEKSHFLALRSITLDFGSEIIWDLSNLTLELIEWLKNPATSTTSKVGILSSPEFFYLVNSYVNDEISMNFQQMLYAESLAYTQQTTNDKHHLSIPELQQIGGIAGHNILMFLDRKLKPESLRNCSKGDLQALFLLVIGTILAVSYAHDGVKDDVSLNWATPSKDLGHSTQFRAMQNLLCQILAHYVVYLGSKLGLLSAANHIEKFILEASNSRWHKEGIFLWSTCSTHEPRIDRRHQSKHCLHMNVLSGSDDNFIPPVQSYNSQAPFELDSVWEARRPIHHSGGDSLSPFEEVQSNNQSSLITSQQTRFANLGSVEKISPFCGSPASNDSDFSITQHLKHPARGFTNTSGEKDPSFEGGLLPLPNYNGNFKSHGIETDISLPEYVDNTTGLYNGRWQIRNAVDLNFGAISGDPETCSYNHVLVETEPVSKPAHLYRRMTLKPYGYACAPCPGRYTSSSRDKYGRCNSCGLGRPVNKSLRARLLKTRQNLLV